MKLSYLLMRFLPLTAIAMGVLTPPILAQKTIPVPQPIQIDLPAQDQQIFAPEDDPSQNEEEKEDQLDQQLNEQGSPNPTTFKETPAPLQQDQQHESTAPNEEIQIQQR